MNVYDQPAVVAVMPCLGRVEATVALIPRLFSTCAYSSWLLVLVCDERADYALSTALDNVKRQYPKYPIAIIRNEQRLGYWGSMSRGALSVPDASLIVNLANDLLPGRSWLLNSVMLYGEKFGAEHTPGIVGYNDGFNGPDKAAHFLASRQLLQRWYGDKLYPTHYDHNFGDTIIIERAKRAHAFVACPYASLYHNHPVNGAAFDAVYERGQAQYGLDAKRYEQEMRTL